jgi:hypothetical protein
MSERVFPLTAAISAKMWEPVYASYRRVARR